MARRARRDTVISLPDKAEAALEDVAAKSAKTVEYLIEVLMPDGRPFGMVPKSEDEQLQEYIQGGYHDNVDACVNKARELVGQVTNTLMAFGMQPAEMAQAYPYDIAESAALAWSAKMEKLLMQRSQTAPTAEASAWPIPSR